MILTVGMLCEGNSGRSFVGWITWPLRWSYCHHGQELSRDGTKKNDDGNFGQTTHCWIDGYILHALLYLYIWYASHHLGSIFTAAGISNINSCHSHSSLPQHNQRCK